MKANVIPPLFAHQKESLKILAKQPCVFDTSDPGCVSADTEFLTPTGWKRIDKYTEGDCVAQFYPTEREIEFVKPIAYVKRPCTQMIAINPVRGTSQRLSHEHRILYYKPNGTHGVCSAAQFMAELHQHGPNHYQRKFCTTFSVRGNTTLALDEGSLRLMVAVIADGHFPSESTANCTIRLKKSRKIERLRELLFLADIKYEEKTCGGQPDFQVFRFYAPRHEKEFGTTWWTASQDKLITIADELPHWDSSIDTRPSNGIRFSSFSEASANFAQYAFSAAKHPTSIKMSYRNRTAEGRGHMFEYTVHAQVTDKFIGPGRKESVFEIDNPEGFKYCFEVPTSFLLLRHNGYIFATGNTGKTRVGIDAFTKRRRKGKGCLLVIAQKTLLTSVWKNDFATFAPDMVVSVATATNREAAFAVDADVYVTNHDAAVWLAARPTSFWKKFDTLEIDESTAFKHHTSKRSRAIAKIVSHFDYRRLSTGTPDANGLCDLWHQMYLVDGGKRLGKSFFAFRSAVCTPEQVGPVASMVKWVDRPNAEAAVSMLMKDVVIRHAFEDCVDIPPNHQYSVSFELTKKHFAHYKELEDTSILELKNSTVSAINGAVLYTKLLQTASGAVYDDSGAYSLIASERYEMILDLVEARKHSIVFFNWTHQRDELLKLAAARGITFTLIDGSTTQKQRDESVQHYQAGFYQVLFAHPASAGHGLTLTRGTATIWASPTPNLEHYLQGLKRIHRIGQKEKTETIVIIAKDTVDERVWASLQNKQVNMKSLLQFLKDQK